MARAELNGIGIEYQDGGSGPAVLLTHGYSATGRMWDGQRQALGHREGVVARAVVDDEQLPPPGRVVLGEEGRAGAGQGAGPVAGADDDAGARQVRHPRIVVEPPRAPRAAPPHPALAVAPRNGKLACGGPIPCPMRKRWQEGQSG